MVNYSSAITEVVDHSWYQIQGWPGVAHELAMRTGLSAGHTSVGKPASGMEYKRFNKELKDRSSDPWKVVYFNGGQVRYLTDNIYRLVFLSDYSTGKRAIVYEL